MRKYVFIGCGSFVGAIARYLLEQVKPAGSYGAIPLNTLVINLTGAFLMGFLLTAMLDFWAVNADLRAGLTTGLLGAYTTFSTMCKEASALFFQSNALPALLYLAVSASFGLAAVGLGILSARAVGARSMRRRESEQPSAEEPEVD